MTSNLFFLAGMALSRGAFGVYRERLAQGVVRPEARLFCPGQILVEPGLKSLSGGAR